MSLNSFRNLAVVAAIVLGVASAAAHEMVVKGTVAAIEPARIQVKTGEEKKGQAPTWYAIDAKTKVVRDKSDVSLAQAGIKTGERVVLTIDHQADGKMKTLEIHLAAR
jgi:hypothetical protein